MRHYEKLLSAAVTPALCVSHNIYQAKPVLSGSWLGRDFSGVFGPVFRRSPAVTLTKHPGEIIRIGKAALSGNGLDRQIGMFQQMRRFFQTQTGDVMVYRGMEMFLELFSQRDHTGPGGFGDLRAVQIRIAEPVVDMSQGTITPKSSL